MADQKIVDDHDGNNRSLENAVSTEQVEEAVGRGYDAPTEFHKKERCLEI